VTRAHLSTLGAALSLILCSANAQVTRGAADLGIRPDREVLPEQYLLLGDATRGSGESQVAVNPTDPNNIIVAAMSVMNSDEGRFEYNELEFKRTTRAVITQFAVTHDRGLTWSVIEDPMRAYYHRYRCLDPFAAFTPTGTAIVGCEAQRPTSFDEAQQTADLISHGTATYGGPAIITSINNGYTWGAPIQVLGNPMPKQVFGPFVSFDPAHTWADFPKIRVDDSTGKIYVSGQSSSESAPKHWQMVIRGSADGGRDWGMVYAIDTPQWLEKSWGSYDVANGVVVTTYLASAAPQALHAKCPCWVFGASTDDGKKYQRHIIPVAAGAESPSGLFSGIYADPSKPGHYIFLAHTHGAGGRVDVYETDDTGVTWSGPNSIGEVPGASVDDLTAQFGHGGTFAIAWRAEYQLPGVRRPPHPGIGNTTYVVPDGSYTSEIWSVLSRDGGRTFSLPLKVSTARSPNSPRRRGMLGHGMDFDSVALDRDYVHVTWWDARSGFVGTWYGRVPLSSYQFRH
jgi:hypothetical protein